MKTISEVIDLFDNGCIRPCVECPCYGMKECQEQLAAESYYLHKYQKIEYEYDELKDWWAEEHTENVPLTWDELKQMLGKPVWIEEIEDYKILFGQWDIISGFGYSENFDLIDYQNPIIDFYISGNRTKFGLGKTWKAYRKERK